MIFQKYGQKFQDQEESLIFRVLSFHMHSFLTAILTDMYCSKVLVSVPYMHLGEKINGFPVSRMPNEFPKKHFILYVNFLTTIFYKKSKVFIQYVDSWYAFSLQARSFSFLKNAISSQLFVMFAYGGNVAKSTLLFIPGLMLL